MNEKIKRGMPIVCIFPSTLICADFNVEERTSNETLKGTYLSMAMKILEEIPEEYASVCNGMMGVMADRCEKRGVTRMCLAFYKQYGILQLFIAHNARIGTIIKGCGKGLCVYSLPIEIVGETINTLNFWGHTPLCTREEFDADEFLNGVEQ